MTNNAFFTRQYVWDLVVRCFHWSLVMGFATSFVSGELNAMTLHEWTGYGLCGLLVLRIIWGVAGSTHARFVNFLYPPRAVFAYLRSLQKGSVSHFTGHNPAGAMMVFALLTLVTALCLTGLLTLASIDFEGPLLFISRRVDDVTAYSLQATHEFLPWVALGFVMMHVAGVIVSSRIHKENLVRSMITGFKDVPASNADSIPNKRTPS